MLQALRFPRSLNLSGNRIGTDGAGVFGEALEVNRTLRELHLVNNWITTDGFGPICQALRTNSTLETLDISGNGIGSPGGASFASALRRNRGLKVAATAYCTSRRRPASIPHLYWPVDAMLAALLSHEPSSNYSFSGLRPTFAKCSIGFR